MSRLFELAQAVGTSGHKTIEFPIPEWSKDKDKPLVAYVRALTDSEHNKVKSRSGSMRAYEEAAPTKDNAKATRQVMEIDIARSARNNADGFMVLFGLCEDESGKTRFFRNSKEVEQAQDWVNSGPVFARAAAKIRELTEGDNGENLDIDAAKND